MSQFSSRHQLCRPDSALAAVAGCVSRGRSGRVPVPFTGEWRCRVSEIARRHNVSVACWEDGLYTVDGIMMARSSVATRRVYSYAWNNVWQYGQAGRAHLHANHRFTVRLLAALALHLYSHSLVHPRHLLYE